jgi:hypothetical protein
MIYRQDQVQYLSNSLRTSYDLNLFIGATSLKETRVVLNKVFLARTLIPKD